MTDEHDHDGLCDAMHDAITARGDYHRATSPVDKRRAHDRYQTAWASVYTRMQKQREHDAKLSASRAREAAGTLELSHAAEAKAMMDRCLNGTASTDRPKLDVNTPVGASLAKNIAAVMGTK